MTAVRRRWLVFGFVAGALVAALAWASVLALAVEQQRNEMREYYAQESVMRLALARVDSIVTYLVAGESARPYYEYQPFYTESHALDQELHPVLDGEVRIPSPLLDARSDLLEPFFRLHFQLSPPGVLSSPQVPVSHEREVAVLGGHLTRERLIENIERLEQLGKFVDYSRLVNSLEDQPGDEALARSLIGPIVQDLAATRVSLQKGARDLRHRSEALEIANLSLQSRMRLEAAGEQPVEQGMFRSFLFANPITGRPELVLVRPLRNLGQLHVQGIWASWTDIRLFLEEQAADLFPGQRLEIVPSAGREESEGPWRGQLASLPALLIVKDPAPAPERGLTTTALTLIVTWIALLTALTAVGVLLHRTLELSERRGRFVSAVTHELRTPLTTFCMYSEMLAEGVVRDEEAVREYLETLRSEAARLRRIVDNVLVYARVEGQGARTVQEQTEASSLFEELIPDLARRADEAGFELVTRSEGLPADAIVEVDAQAVEQILGNLVDNACKYAVDAEDRQVQLMVSVEQGRLHVVVRDRGPGVPPGLERDIFDAFRRATGDQSGRIPGIGLGLTLSRGMARQMRGELSLVATPDGEPGAAFRLEFPLVPPSGA